MGTVNYNCPSCAAPLTFNPERQRFCCDYCLSEFSPEKMMGVYLRYLYADTRQDFGMAATTGSFLSHGGGGRHF